MEESIFGLRETRKKLGTNAKDGSATADKRLCQKVVPSQFHFAMLSAPRVNRLARGRGCAHSISSQVAKTAQP
jgi:hypothetical protein